MKANFERTLSFILVICMLFMATPQFQVSAVSNVVSYNGNGNTAGSVPTDNTLYSSGDTVTVAENTGNLVKNGYVFAGWNTAANGTGTDYGTGTTFTFSSTIVLYAKWASEDPYLRFDSLFINLGPNASPSDFETDSNDNTYLTDHIGTYRIKKYNSSGQLVWQVGLNGTGTGQLLSPYGLDLDSSANVYVSDINNHKVSKFSKDGVYITSSVVGLSGPYDVAVNRSTGDVYVADTYNKRIVKLNANLQYVSHFSVSSEMNDPAAICIDGSGNLYVGDHYSKKLVKYNSSGTKITSVVSDELAFINDLNYDGTYLYAAIGNPNQMVKLLASDLSFVYKWPFFGCSGTAKDSTGKILVATIIGNDRGIVKSRVASNNNNLSSLSVNGQSLSPFFNKNTTNYTINVSNSVTSISMTPVAEDSKASIRVGGATVTSGEPKEFSLGLGDNPIELEVTADCGDKKVYTVNVKVSIPPDQIIVRADDGGYIWDGYFGSELYVGGTGGDCALRFNLTGITQTILSASLNLQSSLDWSYKAEGVPFVYKLYGSEDDSWIGGESFPTTKDVTIIENDPDDRAPGYWKSFDVKAFVNGQSDTADKLCSFVISSENASADDYIYFYGLMDPIPSRPYLFIRLPAINKSSANFDKYILSQNDISFDIILEDTLKNIKNGDNTIDSSNYTVSGNTVIIKKAFLTTLPLGNTNLTVNMNACSSQMLSINVSDTTPIGDTTPPTIMSVTGNPTSWQNTDVTLTVSASDDESDVAVTGGYSFDGGMTWQNGNTKTFSSNANGIVVKVKDADGNIASFGTIIDITKIDKTTPTITSVTGNPTSWQNTDVTLTVSASDVASGIVVNAYSFDGGVTWQSSNAKTYTANVNGITVKVKDAAGNIACYGTGIDITKIDKTAPTITSVTGNPTSWQNTDVTLTVSASDAGSGIAVNAYSFDGGVTWQSSNAMIFLANANSISIKVKDSIGNISTSTIIDITKIDKVAPTNAKITIGTNEFTSFLNTITFGLFFKEMVDVTITGIDTTSGIQKFEYQKVAIQSEYNANGTWTTGSTFNITPDEKFIVYAKITDNAGNHVIINSNGIIVDSTNPDLGLSDTADWKNADLDVTVTVSDNLAGVKSVCYTTDEIIPQTGTVTISNGTGTITLKNNGIYTISVTAEDNSGNTVMKTATIKIDKTAPTITSVTGNPTSWQNTDVTLSISASDIGSGIVVNAYSFDGGTTWQSGNTKTYTANANGITVKVKDDAGNVTTYGTVIDITKIDKTAPTITSVTGNATGWQNTDVTLSVLASDTGSGIAVNAYSFDGGTTWQNGNTKSYSANTSNIVIKARDALGNISQADTFNITKIDKEAPTNVKITVGTNDFNSFLNTITFGIFFKETVAVSITGIDTASGIQKYEYQKVANESEYNVNGTWISGSTFSVTPDEKFIVYARITDNVDNSVIINTDGIIVDSTEPDLSLSDTAGWKTENIDVTVTVSDCLAGIKDISYTTNETQPQSGTVTISNGIGTISMMNSGSYILEVTAIDNSGNTVIKTTEIMIDKTIPTITITGNPTDWVKNANLTITTSDTDSGIASVAVKKDYDDAVAVTEGTYTITSNGSYLFTVIDNAGRTNSTTVVINKIDTTSPEISSLTGNPAEWTKDDVTLTITASDAGCGISEIGAYSFDGGTTWQNENTKSYSANRSNIVIKVKDALGNISQADIINITKIDKETPYISVTGNPSTMTQSATLKINTIVGTSGKIVTVIKNGGDAQTITDTNYIITSNGSYVFTVTNGAGVSASTTVDVTNIEIAVDTDNNSSNDVFVGGVAGDLELRVILIKDKDEVFETSAKAVINNVNGKELITLFDIKLLKNNTVVQPNGMLTIKMLIPENLRNRDGLEVVYVSSNNTLTKMNSSRDGNYLVFTTDHLSNYGIVANVKPVIKTPNTGDNENTPLIIFVLFILVAWIMILANKKSLFTSK